MTAVLVVAVPVVLAVFAGQMERLESAVLGRDTDSTDPTSTATEPEEDSGIAADHGTGIETYVEVPAEPAEAFTSTR
ncbi:hypothetical protein [Corynebacterium halotolerans]|uniref:hypothetical protein n=1 Tax=Corynebacterium halotolerans TaxID=225326 RepID=UPI0011EA70BD|nr:hypothetical protein [Corynebacterium halotolerans]